MKTIRQTHTSKLLLALAFILLPWGWVLKADEGMWLPLLLSQINEDEMHAMGMELSAEDIYSINQSSLKDAIVHFNGGCSAEVISMEGLILTNHHCGYSQIQQHSSLENDYLKHGFWAMSKEQELPNENLNCTFIKRIEDVTKEALEGISDTDSEAKRNQILRENFKAIQEKYAMTYGYDAQIKSFYKGNSYYIFLTETFDDIRLVGAPPSSVGKYGHDTDNWAWPRHTGDFSMFRIYADENNKSATYSESNVPYKPESSLKINIGGYTPGDFTLVYGFPGTTDSYLPSYEVKEILEHRNPARIALRDASLSVLDKYMRAEDKVRIQYASIQSRISNAWKKWKGESLGLQKSNAVSKKEQEEREFQLAVRGGKDFQQYDGMLQSFQDLYAKRLPYLLARDYFIETEIVNVSSQKRAFYLLRSVPSKEDLSNEETLTQWKEYIAKQQGNTSSFKNFDARVDREILEEILWINAQNTEGRMVDDDMLEYSSKGKEKLSKMLDKWYKKSILVDEEKWNALWQKDPEKILKILDKDPLVEIAEEQSEFFFEEIQPSLAQYSAELDSLMRRYMNAQIAMSDEALYPDANGTLRVGYGLVEGMEAKDGVQYVHQTFLSGAVDKYIPEDYEFDMPKGLIELFEKKDFGMYADSSGRMPLCFIASNHTTGGNSGSAVLNGKGELIGLNFDRLWEGTMSDLNYDKALCRNIMVDLRYVLFIVDKYAGAKHLVEEMELVK